MEAGKYMSHRLDNHFPLLRPERLQRDHIMLSI